MKYHQKQTGRATSMAKGLTLGVLSSIVATIVSAGIIAKMLDKEILQWSNVGYGITISLLIGSFLCAWLSFQKIKRQRLLVCGVSGLLYWLVLLCLAALFFEIEYGSLPITAVVIFVGSLGAFIASAPKKRSHNKKKFHISHR